MTATTTVTQTITGSIYSSVIRGTINGDAVTFNNPTGGGSVTATYASKDAGT